jgi:hypothetical protein
MRLDLLLSSAVALLILEHGGGAGGPNRLVCADGPLSVETEWHDDPLVFTATAISGKDVEEGDFTARTIYRVKVRRVFRGRPDRIVTLYSENDSGRFPLDVDSTYLLFVSRWDGHLRVSNCGNSGLLSSAGSALGRIRALRAKSGHS